MRGRTILTPTGHEWHGYELFLTTRSSELYLTSCTVQPLKEDPPLTAAMCHRTVYLSAIQGVMSPGVILLGIRKRIVYKDEDIC